MHTSLGQRFDNAALSGSHLQHWKTRAKDISQLQQISADSFAVVLMLIAVVGILRRRPRLGIAAARAAASRGGGDRLLKNYVLTRPELAHDSLITANTFPSGHTATAIACALALVLVTPPRWRGAAAVIGGSYAWITAAQVQTAGWHRPSDAVGAALLGFAAVATVAALLSRWRPSGYVEGTRHRIALAVLGVVWLAAAAAAGLRGDPGADLPEPARLVAHPHHGRGERRLPLQCRRHDRGRGDAADDACWCCWRATTSTSRRG